jgi:hypothetical protein
LPLDLVNTHLPVCVHIHTGGKTNIEAKWVETYDVTFSELDREVSQRTVEIKANRDLENLKRLREYLAPHMKKKPSEPIGPMLEKLAGRGEGGARVA